MGVVEDGVGGGVVGGVQERVEAGGLAGVPIVGDGNEGAMAMAKFAVHFIDGNGVGVGGDGD